MCGDRFVGYSELTLISGCEEQTQILHFVQDDSALAGRVSGMFGVAGLREAEFRTAKRGLNQGRILEKRAILTQNSEKCATYEVA